MTIKRTVAVSLFFHFLIVYGALLAIKNVPMEERILFVEIGPAVSDDTARNRDTVKPPRTETRGQFPVPAPKRKKASPSSMNREKQTDSRTGEGVRERTPEPVPSSAGESSLPALPETGQVTGKAGRQGSLERGTDGLSVSLYDQAGTSMNSVPSGLGSGEQHLTKQIREAIERAKTYPALARKRRQEGTVVMEFSINSKGVPENIEITRSSGFSLLDGAAKETLIRAAPLPVVKGSIEVPITFILKKEN